MNKNSSLTPLVVIFLAALILAALFAPHAVDMASKSLLRKVEQNAAGQGFGIAILYDRVKLGLPRRITWKGVAATLSNEGGDIPVGAPKDIMLRAEEILVELTSLRERRLTVKLRGATLMMQRPQAEGVLDDQPIDIFIHNAAYPIIYGSAQNGADARNSSRLLLKSLFDLFSSGCLEDPFEFLGDVGVTVEGQKLRLGLRAEPRGAVTCMKMDRSGLRQVSDITEDGLTPAEIDVLSDFPLRASALLSIHRFAKTEAKKAVMSDPRVPDDAFRHVLWSYLLTKAYGRDFAARVTDAHETGDNKNPNTPAEHRMDEHNNQIGIRWAGERETLTPDMILSRVLSDPAVIPSSDAAPAP